MSIDLKDGIKQLIQLRGDKLSKKDRWKLSKKWLKGLNSASISFSGVVLLPQGFDAVVTTDGWKEIYIGIPGAFRVWLKLDGTYKMDIPNQLATQSNNEKSDEN